jgi:hypothetical protein
LCAEFGHLRPAISSANISLICNNRGSYRTKTGSSPETQLAETVEREAAVSATIFRT